MSHYISIRFSGIVKHRYRPLFQSTHSGLLGGWGNSFINDKYDSLGCFIPMHTDFIAQRWKDDPWECTFDYDSGLWEFQCSVDTTQCSWLKWERSFIPKYIDEVIHYETYEETENTWAGDYSRLSTFKDGKFKLIGYIDQNGKLHNTQTNSFRRNVFRQQYRYV